VSTNSSRNLSTNSNRTARSGCDASPEEEERGEQEEAKEAISAAVCRLRERIVNDCYKGIVFGQPEEQRTHHQHHERHPSAP
jgi:hypothetical protein